MLIVFLILFNRIYWQVKTRRFLFYVTKAISLPFRITGQRGEDVIGFSSRYSIKRIDYDVWTEWKHTTDDNFIGIDIGVEIAFWTKKTKGKEIKGLIVYKMKLIKSANSTNCYDTQTHFAFLLNYFVAMQSLASYILAASEDNCTGQIEAEHFDQALRKIYSFVSRNTRECKVPKKCFMFRLSADVARK